MAGALQHEEHLKELIANITHDLRTPLTVIDGHLQMLQKSSLNAEQQKRIDTALKKAIKMKELTSSFYDLSILDEGRINPRIEMINFTNLLMDFLSENALLFERNGISPVINLPATSVFVKADRNMLERIFQNLITNAIRYTSGTIEISLFQANRQTATLQICNSIAITDNLDITRLFERFYTGDMSRGNGSTGVGLAVVKLLAEKMHGMVNAQIQEQLLLITLMLPISKE